MKCRRAVSTRRFARAGWGRGVAAAEGVVEVRQIAEADLEGDGADGPAGVVRMHQHSMGAFEPFSKEEARERGPFGAEEQLDVPRRYALTPGSRRQRQVMTAQMLGDLPLDRIESHSTH